MPGIVMIAFAIMASRFFAVPVNQTLNANDYVLNLVEIIGVPISYVGLCFVVAIIAHPKGRNPIYWLFISLLVTPLVLIPLLLIPGLKQCPLCRQKVDKKVMFCRLCGHRFY